MPTHTTQTIADHVDGELVGPGDLPVTGLNTLADASAGQLTLVTDAAYADRWAASAATAALVSAKVELEPGDGRALIRVKDAELAMAAVLGLYATDPVTVPPGVHPTAIVDAAAELGAGVAVGPLCYVGPGVKIGPRTVLHPRVTVLDRCTIGADCILWPGVVIGADGFGYRPNPQAEPERSEGPDRAAQPPILRVPHIGTVAIGDRVEIGANTCVDRGKFAATTIGDDTKIDNLCMIAHNCRVGTAVLIAGCCGLAGSSTVGDGAMLGGGVSLKDHCTIGKGCQVAGTAGVMNDIPDGETWGGTPAKPVKVAIREEMAVRKLPDLIKQMKRGERGG